MNRTEFIIATAGILFAAFALGWLIRALLGRFQRVAPQSIAEIEALADQLKAAKAQRDQAQHDLAARESDLTQRLSRTADELRLALDSLAESRTEIEELRAYIDRKLLHGPDKKP